MKIVYTGFIITYFVSASNMRSKHFHTVKIILVTSTVQVYFDTLFPPQAKKTFPTAFGLIKLVKKDRNEKNRLN